MERNSDTALCKKWLIFFTPLFLQSSLLILALLLPIKSWASEKKITEPSLEDQRESFHLAYDALQIRDTETYLDQYAKTGHLSPEALLGSFGVTSKNSQSPKRGYKTIFKTA